MSPLGFKAKSGQPNSHFGRGTHDICFLKFTSGVTSLLVCITSIAASHPPQMLFSAEVGCRDLNRGPPVRQSDALKNLQIH